MKLKIFHFFLITISLLYQFFLLISDDLEVNSYKRDEFNSHQIFDLFLHDHKKLANMLKDLLKYLQRHPLANIPQISLKHLVWQFQRHIYLEEKALFLFCELKNELNSHDNHNLLYEHDKIIKLLDGIIKNPPDLLVKLEEFDNVIKNHVKWETEGVYLKFDEKLSPHEKNYIIKELNHTSEQGFYPIKKLREKLTEIPSFECISHEISD